MNHSVIRLADSVTFNAKAGIMSALLNPTDDSSVPLGSSVHVYQSKAPRVGWRPIPQPGITLSAPAIELHAKEYDAIACALIVDLRDDPTEAKKVAVLQRKGGVIERGGKRDFMRGRL